MTHYSGGYLIHKLPLIRKGIHAHTSTLSAPLSDLTLSAINAVQATPWTINRNILAVVEQAWRRDVKIPGAEAYVPVTLPRLADDVWDGMSPEDRKAHRSRLHAMHSDNASALGRSGAFLDCLTVAQELRDAPAFYYPHTMDFRHRIYPAVSAGPNPQGSDVSKALIHFAEGVPLGEGGLFWLMVRAANTFGQDKLSLEERVQWTQDHQDDIKTAAQSPLDDLWWTQADEPWQFLATCLELVEIGQDPEGFISHLPVPMDGSCNGLQHLAAMGRDTTGAEATNLRANLPRQDIYARIAARAAQSVERDVAAGSDVARAWHGKVERNVVKRAVMTTPYGVTDRGIRDQLLADGHVPDTEKKGEAADYLRDLLVEALSDTVQSARSIMAWLQTTASRLAEAGVPMDWTTPAGSRVRQAYLSLRKVEVRTLAGRLILQEELPGSPLNARKQALASAPNVIHSFDAAHLSMTVDAAAGAGIRAFSMIHDSYGTHAGNTPMLYAILRDQFVAIYSEDWVEKLYQEFKSVPPGVDLPPPPMRGAFDVSEVLNSEFFFS